MTDLQNMFNESWLSIDDSLMYDKMLIYKESKGMNVWMVDDEIPYTDLVLGYSSMNFGHNPTFLIDKLRDIIGKIHHIHALPSKSAIELCHKIKSLVDGEKSYKVYLPVGGAETVGDSIKLALVHTKKNMLVKCDGAFHGFGHYSIQLTEASFIKNKETYLGVKENVVSIPYCNPKLCEYGSLEKCKATCLDNAEKYLIKHSNEIACIIVEPIQGANGFIIPRKEYAERINNICEINNILLIVDEIQVGIGRSGTMFAYENIGFKNPDMILLGKSLAGGLYPLGAIICREDIANSVEFPAPFGSTFSRSPIGCSLAIAVLDFIDENSLLLHVQKIGELFLEELKNSLKNSFIKRIRGRGLCIAFDVEDDTQTISSEMLAKAIIKEGINNKLLIYSCGETKNTIKLSPYLTIKKEEVLIIVEKLKNVCCKVEKMYKI